MHCIEINIDLTCRCVAVGQRAVGINQILIVIIIISGILIITGIYVGNPKCTLSYNCFVPLVAFTDIIVVYVYSFESHTQVHFVVAEVSGCNPTGHVHGRNRILTQARDSLASLHGPFA